MAIRYSNNASGGTLGATVSSANSGGASGNFFDVATGSEVYQFANAFTRTLPLSYKIAGTTAGQAVLGWGTGTLYPNAAFRFYFWLTGSPSAAMTFCQIRVGSTNSFWVNLLPDRKMSLNTTANPSIDILAAPLAVNTMYRMEMLYRSSTSTGAANGLCAWAVYAGDSTTPIQTFTKNDATTTAGPVLGARFGKLNNSVVLPDTYFDNIIWDDGGTTWIGPMGVPPSIAMTQSDRTVINTAGSVGTMSIEQTGGPTATVTGPVSGVFTIIHPTPFLDTMAFTISSFSEGETVSEDFLVEPSQGPLDELVYNGTAWI